MTIKTKLGIVVLIFLMAFFVSSPWLCKKAATVNPKVLTEILKSTSGDCWEKLRHFEKHEFESKDGKQSPIQMDCDVLQLLDEVRERYGQPIIVTSGKRTNQHNKNVGGVKDSAHKYGLAVDLKVSTSRERYELIKLIILVALDMDLEDFLRIGVYDNLIHFDLDPSKPSNVLWSYVEQKGPSIT